MKVYNISKYNLIFRELIDRGLLQETIIDEVVAESYKTGKDVFKILVDYGYISRETLLTFIDACISTEIIDLSNTIIQEPALDRIPDYIARFHTIIPISINEGTLIVAFADPLNIRLVSELRAITGLDIKFVIAKKDAIKKAISIHYWSEEETLENILDEANISGNTDFQLRIVVKIVYKVILNAIREQASYIHFEQFGDYYKLIYRIDGICRDYEKFPKDMSILIVSHIKEMANLDVIETQLPHNGKIVMDIEGKEIDLRIWTLPTIYGESIGIKVFYNDGVILSLDQLDMNDSIKFKLRNILHKQGGIILVAGPLGSGKTTTLYSCIKEIDTVRNKVVAIEDAIEYEIEGVTQVTIDPKIDSFTKALQQVFNLSPDILMIGEICDSETAELLFRAGLNGHLIFSTLHTNDAISSIRRLIDMGIDSFLISSVLRAIIAQRLVRIICPECKELYKPSILEISQLGFSEDVLDTTNFYKGRGCLRCNNSGYKGRTGIYELLVVNDAIKELIGKHAGLSEIKDTALKSGMKRLYEDGARKVLEGITTVEEALKATNSSPRG